MTDVFKGIVAGGVATVALSTLMLVTSAAGLLPHLNLIQLLLSVLSAPQEHVLGWVLHSAVGSVLWGGLYAQIEPRLGADSCTKSGILFGVILWLTMMLVFMPAVGAGYFGFQVSHLVPIVMLALHVVYGAVLGWTYGKLSQTHTPLIRHHAA